MLNVLEERNREAMAITIRKSPPSHRVVQMLEQRVILHGPPTRAPCDNGPELIAVAVLRWREADAILLKHIQSHTPNQNALIERFNRTYRGEVLDAPIFTSPTDVRQVTETSLRCTTQSGHTAAPAASRRAPIFSEAHRAVQA